MASKYQQKLERRKNEEEAVEVKDVPETGLRQFMGNYRRKKLGGQPTRHDICMKLFGVARPGKTARDRAK